MFEGMSEFLAMKQTSESTSKQIEMAVALNENCPWLLLKVGLADYLSFTIYLY